MVLRLLMAGMLVGAAVPNARAAESPDARRMYAMVEAAGEYCPGLEPRFGWSGMVRYDPSADGEASELRTAKADWFRQFRKAGRSAACEMLADSFGPGGEPHFFDLND